MITMSDSAHAGSLSLPGIKRAWRFTRGVRRAVAAYVVVGVFSSVATVVPPLLFKRIIDHAIPSGDRPGAARLAILAASLAVLATLAAVTSRWLGARIGFRLVRALREDVFRNLQRMPIAFFGHTPSGVLMSRISNDVQGAEKAFTLILRVVVSNAVTLFVVFVALFSLNFWLALAALAVFPPLALLIRVLANRVRAVGRDYMDHFADLNTFVGERLNPGGAIASRIYSNEGREATELDRASRLVEESGIRQATLGRFALSVLPMAGAVVAGMVYLYGSQEVMRGAWSLGSVVAFAALVQRLYEPLVELADARLEFTNAFISFERVFEVSDTAKRLEPQVKPGATIPCPDGPAHIEFKDVSFTYLPQEIYDLSASSEALPAEGSPTLSNVSFAVNPGETVAIVGATGAGKSSVLGLAARLYLATSGTVSLNGVSVANIEPEEYYARVGFITQESFMFHASIRQNLLYAKPDASAAELRAACSIAQVLDLIEALPSGFDTLVGERGVRLSGGEKQRVAIARMLLKDPTIVLMDEATAHLDVTTERKLQAAMQAALRGRTAIVVAHRLSTVMSADQILVMEHGRIVQRGRHDDLVREPGAYATLFDDYFRTGAVDVAS